MKKALTKKQLKKLEIQLSKPSGNKGIEIGNKMYLGNLSMIKSSISLLNVNDFDKILEIGHGNGKHLPFILTKAYNLSYSGIEVSKLMKKEAEKFSSSISANNQTEFIHYNGIKIPFKNQFFDRVLSINTIYFWENPLSFLKEIYRVLKKDGKLIITFAQKEFMQNLPFVKKRFNLYDNKMFEELAIASNFKIERILCKKEMVENKVEEIVIRKYNAYILKK